MVWGAIGSIGASLISGGLGYLGAQDSNKDARRMQKRQFEFQERMYKNRYRYQMADMRRAGLNPILAYGQAPPGAPAGAAAIQPLNELGAVGAEVSRGINSAIAARRMEADVELTEEQVRAAKETVKNIAEDTKLKTEQRNVASSDWMLKSIQQVLTRNQAALSSAQALKINEETLMVQLQRKIAAELEKVRGYESMRAEEKEKVWSGISGKILTWVNEIGQALNPAADAGQSGARARELLKRNP